MNNIGKNIARVRLFKMIGQKEMADYLNISQQEYSRIENKKIVDDKLLELIAQKLDCSVEIIKSLEQVDFISQTVNQNNGNNGIGINNNSIDKICDIYERLLKEKDSTIKQQQDLIQNIKNK